jgi:hypothetical protein
MNQKKKLYEEAQKKEKEQEKKYNEALKKIESQKEILKKLQET